MDVPNEHAASAGKKIKQLNNQLRNHRQCHVGLRKLTPTYGLNSVVVFLVVSVVSFGFLSRGVWKQFARGKNAKENWIAIDTEVDSLATT